MIQRYPPTTDRSLTVFNAADRLLIDWAAALPDRPETMAVFHDRFGAVALSLPGSVHFVSTYHSQETALRLNAGNRSLPLANLLEEFTEPIEAAVLRVPKSLDLFELYLTRIAAAATPTTRVAGGFMTRHFTPRMLEVAGRYAGVVKQSRAEKKARLLLLEDFKVGAGAQVPMNAVEYAGKRYRQLPGVFSAGHIDYATDFLLQHWPDIPEPATITDLACGNGIIGDQLLQRYPDSRLVATDDSILSVASARTNLPSDRSTVFYAHTLKDLPDGSQDLVVTNPPFHFGHENNIDVSLALFREAREKLRSDGILVVVANRHLHYATHLRKWYAQVESAEENDKYVVYCCRKSDGGRPDTT
ncbi:16S rRNA (guanine1207-N2)-methyltransferase [Neolewinella xylanilytica]|uniref:16S rRNA (Guanine1207-N2)-methyltransferase n=1 Tax=Neolewinella xylanilytica TaxID=1514080 RepID=A0A2S6I4V7_9BACT|nr:methyltransferase [Neolewinella xylanilytica]PPK86198.1 16S rRNA (guanine1207-N2)-methyltransferase [Neolewinella xylanilytica]